MSTEDKSVRWQQVGVVAGVVSALVAIIVLLLGVGGQDNNPNLGSAAAERSTSSAETSTSPASIATPSG